MRTSISAKMLGLRELKEKVLELKERKGAVILAHNYQRREVQEVADFVGESLFLAKKALEANAELVVFCGVDFMAETVAALCPDKRVVIPEPAATCPMAAQLPAQLVREARRKHPGVPIVLYINTLAEAKAEADVICTSGNAIQVVRALEADEVLFGPDWNLCWRVRQAVRDKTVIPLPEHGYCYVHKLFDAEEALRLKERAGPGAELLVHPECDPELQEIADFVGSTGQMYEYVRSSLGEAFVVATEVGLIERMKRDFSHKARILPAKSDAICAEMKLITLEKVFKALRREEPIVKLPRDVAEGARAAVERMFELMGVIKREIASAR